ncbi:hypothetical protein LCGC14_2420530, partial [marine sediment metagenome]
TGNWQQGGCDLQAVPRVAFGLRAGESLDARHLPLAPPMVPVPEVAAAEDSWQRGSSTSLGAGDAILAPVAALPYVPTDTYTRFFEGYRAAGGLGGLEEARIDALIWCESSWRLDPGGYHLGLAQFDPGTWATVSAITGYAAPYNPWHQGFNVSVWASMISPGTSAGWPSCWWAW